MDTPSKSVRDLAERSVHEYELAARADKAGRSASESETLYRALFDSAPMAVFVCDRNAVIQHYNTVAVELWGREPMCGVEQHCGSTKLWLPNGELLPHAQSPMVEVLRTGIPAHNVEVYIERPDGSRLPVLVNFAALKDGNGEITGAITSFTDITERKLAEETLRASEELNTAVISSLSAQIAVMDSEGNITAVNQAWQEFAQENNGKSDRTGVGINYLQICRKSAGKFSEHASEALTGIEAVLKGNLPFFSLEYPCHSPKEHRWFLLNVTPFRGEPGGAVISHQNITERKQAEEQLRKSEEFSRSVIESSPDCIKVLDLEGNLLSMEVGQELLCIDDIGPFLNKPWTELWEGIDRQSAKSAVDAAAAGGNGNFVGFFRNMRGEPKWWNVAVSPILGVEGNPASLLAVSRDVTEQKAADDALHRHEWRLRYATESARLTFVEIDLIGGGGAQTPENFGAVMGYPPPVGQEEDASVGSRVLLEHVVPDDRPRVEAALREFFDGKSIGSIDYRVLGDDRIERWIETRWSLELSPDGKPLKSFATNLDITERKRAEEALRNSEERYRNLFDSMDEGYCIIEMIFDKHGKPVDYRYLQVNPSFEKLTGLHGALGKRISELVPDLEEHWFEVYGKVALTGEPIRVADEVKGMNRWFDIYAFRVGGNDSREVAVLFNNITERKRHEANLAFLADIGQDLARITTAEETMRTIGAKIGAYLNLSLCAFIEINEAEDKATVNYDWHREDVPSGVGVHRISDFMNEEFQAAGRAGKTFIIRDTATDERATAESFAAFKIASMVAVPIIKDGKWHFLMCIYRSEASDWREDEISLTQELAARIWTRLESKRMQEAIVASEILKRMVAAQEDERKRIARDMHDQLGQQMTGLRLKLEHIKSMCDDQPICDQIDHAQAHARKIDEEVSFIAFELRPSALDDLGLREAVRNFVKEWSRNYNIPADFHTSKSRKKRLAPEIETNLYRIAQEALNNTLKHARAKNVVVLLEYHHNNVVLVIEDDGIGFNPDEPRGVSELGKGLGLIGMSERCLLIGGKLEIESRAGKGTTIFARVPARYAEKLQSG